MDSSDEEEQGRTQYQTALDTVITNPALTQYVTVAQELQETAPLELEHNLETGLGRLNSVIRELFGMDTIRATLMERPLLDWIRMESRRQSRWQMAWYREFHPGTRYHKAYGEPDLELEEPSPLQLTQEVVRPRMRTAAGGGGDPNDPDDDPRRGNRRGNGNNDDRKDEDRRQDRVDQHLWPC